MLETYAQAEIRDLYGKPSGIKMEVNWNPENENENKCKMIRIVTPEGKRYVVKKEEFLSFLWMIGNDEEHMKMIPQKNIDVRWYETVVSVKATKNIAKGEQITFPIKLTLPSEEKEIVGSLTKEILEGKKKIISK